MHGETDLSLLIRDMAPSLDPRTYVFAAWPIGLPLPQVPRCRMVFEEEEATTLVLEEAIASQMGMTCAFKCRMITLKVHSALEAIGFMAAVATRLTAAGIPANPVSGFHHDHLFVPHDRADEALQLLVTMSPGKAAAQESR